ncbi:hypothetical protein [Acidithiobacillus sulfurivorans]|uniref:Uncharacterized protein n=2 Tax=Acidithiobacillaceae TaxID=225058 RepID=A0ABS5ZYJ0_9PROT|nr:hypothetical protein [Acidithiobacillus sulfurivorans]MBU2759708.1 hypothetical protein [Acidithiobacillus sulfurivorans]
MSQEVITRTPSTEADVSYRNGNRPSEQYARISLTLPEMARRVSTQADLDLLKARINQIPGHDQIRRSGAYHRAMAIAQTRIRTASLFGFDKVGGIKALAYGSGMALYFDRRFGFFFCEPNLYTMGDDNFSVTIAISTFILFAPDSMTEKEAKKRIKEFLPIGKALAEDIQRNYMSMDVFCDLKKPCEYMVKVMKFGYDEVDHEMGTDENGDVAMRYQDEFYTWYGAFRDRRDQWSFSVWEKEELLSWSVHEFIDNISEGPIKRQYAGFLKDIQYLQRDLFLSHDQDTESRTHH